MCCRNKHSVCSCYLFLGFFSLSHFSPSLLTQNAKFLSSFLVFVSSSSVWVSLLASSLLFSSLLASSRLASSHLVFSSLLFSSGLADPVTGTHNATRAFSGTALEEAQAFPQCRGQLWRASHCPPELDENVHRSLPAVLAVQTITFLVVYGHAQSKYLSSSNKVISEWVTGLREFSLISRV